MTYSRIACSALILLVGAITVANDCPPFRPCGPCNSNGGNRLVPQGFYGADFRNACVNHDACYQSCTDRYTCDQNFLNDMNCACESSYNPKACMRKARHYYAMARMFGGLYRQ